MRLCRLGCLSQLDEVSIRILKQAAHLATPQGFTRRREKVNASTEERVVDPAAVVDVKNYFRR